MKYLVSSLLCAGLGVGEAAAQQVIPPFKKEFLDSAYGVLPSATGARYRRETAYADSVGGVVRVYYLNGQLQRREELENIRKGSHHGMSDYYDDKGQLTMHAEFAHGRRTGELRTYYPSGQLKRREQFAATGLSSGGECFAADGTLVPFFAFELMPRYSEGDGSSQAVINAITRNFRYPKDALKAKVEGRVLVAFMVTEQGKVAEVRVTQSLFPSVDANAVQAVYQLKRFEPGRQDGRAVKVGFTVPISLRIQ